MDFWHERIIQNMNGLLHMNELLAWIISYLEQKITHERIIRMNRLLDWENSYSFHILGFPI
jgi:hypothetical protein